MASLGVRSAPILYVPYLSFTKPFIAALGAELGVPYEDTWSCYKGGEHHCGVCSACVGRQEAFALAGVKDPTTYKE